MASVWYILSFNRHILIAPDGFPQSVVAHKHSTANYTITWSQVPKNLQNGIITKYEVRWILGRRGKKVLNQAKTAIITDQLNFTLDGLLVCAQYSLSVRAYTKVGPGPYSEPVNITTQDLSSPDNFTGTNITKTTVVLTWKKPVNAAAEKVKYTIKYSKLPAKGHTGVGDINKKTVRVRTLLVKGLKPGTRYEFWVFASTRCGDGPKSILQITTETACPEAPPKYIYVHKIAHSTNYSVAWFPVPKHSQNGEIMKYEVNMTLLLNVHLHGIPGNRTNVTTTTGHRTITPGLSTCSQYSVSVRGHTSAGPGPYSHPVIITTPCKERFVNLTGNHIIKLLLNIKLHHP